MLTRRRCCCGGNPITIHGCPSLPGSNWILPSHQIDVYDHSGGTLLATVYTDSTGVGRFATGTFWLIPHNGRFVGQNVNTATATSVIFAPASGWYCMGCCGDPFPGTIYGSDPHLALSSVPMTWDPVNLWFSGDSTYNFPGETTCQGCSTAVPGMPVHYRLVTSSNQCISQIVYPTDAFGCPVGAWGANTATEALGLTTVACGPFSGSGSTGPMVSTLYCNAMKTRSLSESSALELAQAEAELAAALVDEYPPDPAILAAGGAPCAGCRPPPEASADG